MRLLLNSRNANKLRELRAAEEEAPRVRGPLTAMRGGRVKGAAAAAPPARTREGDETDAA